MNKNQKIAINREYGEDVVKAFKIWVESLDQYTQNVTFVIEVVEKN